MRKSYLQQSLGFTIVELLVVIVVIGVLAAITIVSYTGITNKAVLASLTSDLTNASTQLKMFQTINSAYPTTISIDCAVTPDTTTNKCLKLSPGNTITSLTNDYSVNNTTNPQTFNLTIKNTTTNIISVVTDNSKPIVLVPAPLSPVADWIATPTGDHYGNYYDSVTKSWATVTRATPKTIYDPATQHIYDVPANKLAVNPRSDGKNGSEAVIEEGRTNYVTNSYNLTGWTDTVGTINDAVYGNTSSIVNVSSGNWTTVQSPYISISPNTTYTLSAYIKHNIAGKNEVARVYQYDSNYTIIGTQIQGSGNDSSNLSWQRVSVTLTTASNVVYLKLNFPGSQGPYTYCVNAVQLEQGAFATSYIPTTTTAITRNVDVVTVPTTGWNAAAGTVVGVTGSAGNASVVSTVVSKLTGPSQMTELRADSNTYLTTTSPSWTYASGNGRTNGSHVVTGTWTNGALLHAYTDGYAGAPSDITTSFAWQDNTASIGANMWGGEVYNGPIQRLIVYSSALSSSDVTTVTNSVKDGP